MELYRSHIEKVQYGIHQAVFKVDSSGSLRQGWPKTGRKHQRKMWECWRWSGAE